MTTHFPFNSNISETFHHGSQFTVGFQNISLVLPIKKGVRFIQANTTISICNGTSYASANHHIPSSIVFKHLGITAWKILWRLFYYRITFIFFQNSHHLLSRNTLCLTYYSINLCCCCIKKEIKLTIFSQQHFRRNSLLQVTVILWSGLNAIGRSFQWIISSLTACPSA